MRLALVTRRFWPLVGGGEVVASSLAAEFRRQGAQPRIVTARWDRRWPAEIVHREVPVVRLSHPAMNFWGTARYMTALRRYLRQHQGEFDLVYVSTLRYDAHATLGALRDAQVPVILRAEGTGDQGDFPWQQTRLVGRTVRRRCLSADAFVACSPTIRKEFLDAGYPEERLHSIPNGVPIPPPRTRQRRLAARQALAEVNPELQLDAAAPLVVFTGRLHKPKGLHDLVAAWKLVAASHPQARLWLVGDGAERDSLRTAIDSRGLGQSVRMPGVFDNIDDVLEAADVFVCPSHAAGTSMSLLEAMAAGLPVVASDIPDHAALVEHERRGFLTPPHDPPCLAVALRWTLENPARAQELGAAARRRVEEAFSLGQSARRHFELFGEVVEKRRR